MNISRFIPITILLLAPCLIVRAEPKNSQRAAPPDWPQEVRGTFFEDARDQLVGERPQIDAATSGNKNIHTSANEAGVNDSQQWSALIEAETVTSEIKQLHNRLASILERPGRFRSGGHTECRRDFSQLAAMFFIVERFDQDVRWHNSAASLRAQCLQAARECQTASDASLALARDVHALLGDLLRGQELQETTAAKPPAEDEQADRGQLMLRMEAAVEEVISPGLASKKQFRKHRSTIAQEAQILSALAQLIRRKQYDYSDDETFLDYALELQRASVRLNKASSDSNFEVASRAAGGVTQSCSDCHEGYRG